MKMQVHTRQRNDLYMAILDNRKLPIVPESQIWPTILAHILPSMVNHSGVVRYASVLNESCWQGMDLKCIISNRTIFPILQDKDLIGEEKQPP